MLSDAELDDLAVLLTAKHHNRPECPGIADDFIASVVSTTISDTVLVERGDLSLDDFRDSSRSHPISEED